MRLDDTQEPITLDLSPVDMTFYVPHAGMSASGTFLLSGIPGANTFSINARLDEAIETFASHARHIPNVRIERRPNSSIVVWVKQGDEQAERAVYSLKAELYQQYPEARLDVVIDTYSGDAEQPRETLRVR